MARSWLASRSTGSAPTVGSGRGACPGQQRLGLGVLAELEADPGEHEGDLEVGRGPAGAGRQGVEVLLAPAGQDGVAAVPDRADPGLVGRADGQHAVDDDGVAGQGPLEAQAGEVAGRSGLGGALAGLALAELGPAAEVGLDRGEGDRAGDDAREQEQGQGAEGREPGIAAAPAPGPLRRPDRAGDDRAVLQEPLEVGRQVAGRRVPAARLLLQALQRDRLQVARAPPAAGPGGGPAGIPGPSAG